jgi:hypothetical protein
VATLLVGYDLSDPGQRHGALIVKLKSFGAWWHHLDSTWVIVANLTAVELRDELKELLEESDDLLVIDITGDSAAWVGLSERAGTWLKSYV